jgi:hypothetical protein
MRAAVVAAAAALVLGCSRSTPAQPPSRASPTTVPGTRPAPSSTTRAVTSTGHPPPATAACAARPLLAAVRLAVADLPATAVASEARCAGGYAAVVVSAPDRDAALAVLAATASGWKLLNFGAAQVCSGGMVPTTVWAALDCGPWEG